MEEMEKLAPHPAMFYPGRSKDGLIHRLNGPDHKLFIELLPKGHD